MDKLSLKTSIWQRVVIVVIALLLLGSTVLTYMFIVMSNSDSSSTANEERVNQLIADYDAKAAELDEAAKPLSDKYFADFKQYLSNAKAYNSAAANAAVLETKDLKAGTGRTLEEGNTDYSAYYIGWCADGTIFQSSFDSTEDPTSLNAPIDPSSGMIEGWNQGIVGMKLGGVREITMAGDLAYGDTREICGGYGSPLKFIVLPIEHDETTAKLSDELSNIYAQLYMAMYSAQ